MARTFVKSHRKDVVAFAIATVLTVILPFGLPSASHAGESIAEHTTVHNPPSLPSTRDEAPFLAENNAAMDKMMADMAVKPTGDVDHDFVEMMVPHHQGAIDMARAVLRYGHNEQLRRLAQEIIVTQQQEIAAMRLALGEPLPPSAAAPTQSPAMPAPDPSATSHHSMSHDSMNVK
jgi:hypothetical protein